MGTMTIRVTSSATNEAGTAFGQQFDANSPSFFDIHISNSTDPNLPNGVYDGYCLNPVAPIDISPASYSATSTAANTAGAFSPVGLSSLTQAQVDQLNWVLAQNFTGDAKFGGQYNYGEVQVAIWKICGYSLSSFSGDLSSPYVTDNGRQTFTMADADQIVADAQQAVASGHGLVPTNAFFTEVLNPGGGVQPLILQLQSGKIGDFVWSDSNADGIQNTGETGIDNVVVQLLDSQGNVIASTVTGDDYSTTGVEHGFYQFSGLQAGDYQVKFIAPAGTLFSTLHNSPNTGVDSDAGVDGLTAVVHLANGESNQTVDAGVVQKAHIGDYVFEDSNGNGIQDGGETGLGGITVNLLDSQGNVVASTTTAPGGAYGFDVAPGTYSIQVAPPSGYYLTKAGQGADPALDSNPDPTTGNSAPITLAPGETNNTVDAGLFRKGNVGNFVWLDADGDGQQGANEAGVGNVQVILCDEIGRAHV